MAYVGSNGKKRYTLKEKYKYYSNKLADNVNHKTGEVMTPVARWELCAKLSDIKSRMARNKKSYNYYSEQIKSAKKSGK